MWCDKRKTAAMPYMLAFRMSWARRMHLVERLESVTVPPHLVDKEGPTIERWIM